MKIVSGMLLAVILLTGCASEKPEPSFSAPPSSEQMYLHDLKGALPEAEAIPDSDLVSTGRSACDTMDRGVTIEELTTAFYENNIDSEMAGAMMGAAVRHLCPHHQEQVDSYLSDRGY